MAVVAAKVLLSCSCKVGLQVHGDMSKKIAGRTLLKSRQKSLGM